MKDILLFLSLIAVTCCSQYEKGPTTIDFESVIFLDQIPFSSVTKFPIYLTNTGQNLLEISRIDVPCSCTEPKWNDYLVKPNETITITIQFTPDQPGEFEEELQITGNFETSYIKFHGYVDPNL